MWRVRSLAWLFLLALAFLAVGNDRLILYSLDEVKNAQAAREMAARGDWVVPTFNGELRTQKPPLAYYAMRAVYAVAGVSPFTARFGSAVAGALTLVLVFAMGARHLGGRAAWIATLGLAASIHFALQMRMSVPDPYLVLCITAAVWLLYLGWQSGTRWQLYLGYAVTGLAILAKGPIGAWLIGATLISYVVWTEWTGGWRPVWRGLLRLRPFEGIAIALLIALPWYVLVDRATTGQWSAEFFGYHNAQRFSEPLEGHGGPFVVTILFVWVGMLPLGIALPQALIWGTRYAHRGADRLSDFLRLLLAGAYIVVGTFCLAATRLPNYTVPAYPFLALAIAAFLNLVLHGRLQVFRTSFPGDGLRPSRLARGLSWNLFIWSVVLLALPIGGYFGLRKEAAMADLAPLAWVLLLLPFGTAIGAVLYRRRDWRAFPVVGGAWLLTSLIVFTWIYPAIYGRNPVSQTLSLIPQDQPVVAFKRFNPAYTFELPLRPIPTFETVDSLASYLTVHPGATVISRTDYQPLLDTLAAPPLRLQVVAQVKDPFENPTTTVLRRARE